MKKNIFYTILLALGVITLASCDKDTEGLSRITYYPVLELAGDTYMVIDKGSTFTDPGYTATLDGEDVSDQVVVTSNVNTSQSGVYTVTYSIVNSDGIAANSSRTVVVLDPNDAVEGFYLTSADSYRLYNGAQVAYGRSFEILIIGNGDGTYSVDDLLGGWYCQRAGYGTNYAMSGVIAVADDGTVSLVDSYIPGWGDGLMGLSGTFNADSKSFSIMAEYVSGMQFYQTWNKE
ncbi:MAG: DUF5012 domain-containing protein [Prevotella sp.]|nr:DUF5012 domain-containing protein [Prevotella sp.]